MNLTTKLSLAIGTGICVVLGVSASFWVRVESQAYVADVRRDHQVLGRSLAIATELLWSTEGEG